MGTELCVEPSAKIVSPPCAPVKRKVGKSFRPFPAFPKAISGRGAVMSSGAWEEVAGEPGRDLAGPAGARSGLRSGSRQTSARHGRKSGDFRYAQLHSALAKAFASRAQ